MLRIGDTIKGKRADTNVLSDKTEIEVSENKKQTLQGDGQSKRPKQATKKAEIWVNLSVPGEFHSLNAFSK